MCPVKVATYRPSGLRATARGTARRSGPLESGTAGRRSLLSFNLGVEVVQLAVIALAFPLLALLRRTPAHRWALPAMTAPIVLVSGYWFCERAAVAV